MFALEHTAGQIKSRQTPGAKDHNQTIKQTTLDLGENTGKNFFEKLGHSKAPVHTEEYRSLHTYMTTEKLRKP